MFIMFRKIFIICILFFLTSAFSLYAQEVKQEAEVKVKQGTKIDKDSATPIVVNGDKVEYDHANKQVRGTGNVSITYQDIKMTCEVIVVDLEKKKGVAGGNVTLYQEGSVFRADEVVYNFEKKTGELVRGSMKMLPWYGKADMIEKVDDKVFKLKTSNVTTCEFEKPHYRLVAKTIKIYLGERITAWHVFFYVGDVPIMYMPYYNHPLKDNLPQVNLVPGHNDEWGTYLLTAWRYYFHPDSKGYVHLDWRSRRGLGEGIDYKYGMRKFGNGYFRFYHLRDREPDESQELGTELPNRRWRAQLRHKWEVDKNTTMIGEYHKLSDQAFLKDYFYKEEYEIEHQPVTYLMLSGAKENFALTYLIQPKVNDFFTEVERLPEAKMSIRSLRLFNHLNLFYDNESSFAELNKNHAKDIGRWATPADNYDALRTDTYDKLYYPFQLFNFLNITPYAGARETFYTEDAIGNNNVTRYILNSGVDLYSRFYKIYNFETDFLNLDIHKLRHLIIPSVKYSYLTTPTIKSVDLRQFDAVDDISRGNSAELALEHKLQTKRKDKYGISETYDLTSFIIKSNFIIDDNYNNQFELSDYVDYDLELKPYDWMSLYTDAKFHRRERQFRVVNTDFGIVKSEDERLSIGYRYEKDENTQVTAYWANHWNKDDWKKHWAFEIYERYEIQQKQFQEQQYTFIKDLHCWTAELTCRVREQSNFTFWVIFRLKAFPDVPFYFRTTYRGPEPGKKQEQE